MVSTWVLGGVFISTFGSILTSAGLDGFRLRPGALPDDLTAITRLLVPELRRRGVFRDAYETGPTTLRERLGLPRPVSRYAPHYAGQAQHG